jgi:hypothetical protein
MRDASEEIYGLRCIIIKDMSYVHLRLLYNTRYDDGDAHLILYLDASPHFLSHIVTLAATIRPSPAAYAMPG